MAVSACVPGDQCQRLLAFEMMSGLKSYKNSRGFHTPVFFRTRVPILYHQSATIQTRVSAGRAFWHPDPRLPDPMILRSTLRVQLCFCFEEICRVRFIEHFLKSSGRRSILTYLNGFV